MSRPTAVQFGAGNIGRGFIAQLFHESGYEVVFVDVVPEVLAALDALREYSIQIVGKGAAEVPIRNVRAVDGRDREAVAAELARCDVACTAVGAGALKFVAPNLAAGLALRHAQGGGPLNVLICENLHDASDHLRDLVGGYVPPEDRDTILADTGFVQAVVSRMVPLQEPVGDDDPADRLAVRVEAYKRLPVDSSRVVGRLPELVGVVPVPNFEAHVERKLYTHNCAHATIGYLGWLAGYTYGYEALADPGIRDRLDRVMAETSLALIGKHGFDPDEHAEHVADLLERFANVELGDTCFRLGRDPVRKLAPHDRLVGAARLCEAQGVPPAELARVIAAALRFAPAEDAVAMALQARLETEGADAVLADVCDIRAGEPLHRDVVAAYAGGLPA